MRDLNVPAFYNSSGILSAEKELSAGTSVYYSRHLNIGDFVNSDGNALIAASIDTESLTVAVACALNLGENLGYGPYKNVLDDGDANGENRSVSFTSAAKYVANLFNQTWFNQNHLGFKLRFTITGSISGGEKITCETSLS